MALLHFVFIITVAVVCFLLGNAVGKPYVKKPPDEDLLGSELNQIMDWVETGKTSEGSDPISRSHPSNGVDIVKLINESDDRIKIK